MLVKLSYNYQITLQKILFFAVKHYKQTHSFTLDDELKNYLIQLKKNKVNVSKFIRDSIEKNKPIPIKPKKYTINELKKLLEL